MTTQPDFCGILAELREALDMARHDLAKGLADRFAADDDHSAAEDLRHVLADCFDWPTERAWRKAREGLR